MRGTILLSLALLFPLAMLSQMMGSIDTVQVASTQIPLRLQETGRNITVIDQKAIRELPVVSLDEVLQLVPGVEIQSRGGFGVQANILMRGSTFTQVLVLVDGMRLNDPLTGHFNGYIPVTVEEIERIEVLRGPAAAMFGPDAVGGLVNIITKTFAGTHKEGIGGLAEFTFGEHNFQRSEINVHGRSDNLIWTLSAQRTQSDGEHIAGRAGQGGEIIDPYRTDFDLKTLAASMAWHFRKGWKLKMRSSLDTRDFNARFFYSNSTLDRSTEQVSQSFSVLHLEQSSQKRHSDLQLSYKYSTDVFEFSPLFPSVNEHEMQFLNMMSNHLFEINERILLKAGAQVDYRDIISNDRGNHYDWHLGLYSMAMYNPLPGLHLTGSLRVDRDDNYGVEWLPQINASYIMGSVVLRGASGRSIRAADYTERFVGNNLENLSPERSLGNPNLLAEVSLGHEIGIDVQPVEGLLLKATGFLRQNERLIDYVRTPASAIGDVGDLQPDASYFFARNITDVITRGIELEAQYDQSIGDKGRLILGGGYTFVQTGNPEEVVSVYIANHARHLATLSSRFHWGKWSAALSVLHKERDPRIADAIASTLEADYTLWNGNISFRPSEHIYFNIQMINIFDVQYQNILGAPMPGRWAMASIGLRL